MWASNTNTIIEKAHPWVEAILYNVYFALLTEALRRIFGTRKLGHWLTPKHLREKMKMASVYANELAGRYVF